MISEQIFTTPGNNSWTCPAGVTTVTVTLIGGGGGGTNNGGGGGGGGAYISGPVTVTPGTTYNISVGAGGDYSVNGGPSTFSAGGNTLLVAGGGVAGSLSIGGATTGGGFGGTPMVNIPGVSESLFKAGNGGKGGDGVWTYIGGGGGGAGGPGQFGSDNGNGGAGGTGYYGSSESTNGAPGGGGGPTRTGGGGGGAGGDSPFLTGGSGGAAAGGGGTGLAGNGFGDGGIVNGIRWGWGAGGGTSGKYIREANVWNLSGGIYGGGGGAAGGNSGSFPNTKGGQGVAKLTWEGAITPTYTYTITANKTSVDEGTSIEFTIRSSPAAANVQLFWRTNSGTTLANDFADNANSGSTNTNSSGIATVTRTLINDYTGEGSENLVFEIATTGLFGDAVASITVPINDTSNIPIVSISASATNILEGGSVVFTVNTQGIPDGGILYWTNIGTNFASDVIDNTNLGTVTINNNVGTITRALKNDLTTEGQKTIIIE